MNASAASRLAPSASRFASSRLACANAFIIAPAPDRSLDRNLGDQACADVDSSSPAAKKTDAGKSWNDVNVLIINNLQATYPCCARSDFEFGFTASLAADFSRLARGKEGRRRERHT